MRSRAILADRQHRLIPTGACFRRALASAAFATLMVVLGPGPVWAETLVESGDVLRITVIEAPAMGREAQVGTDGDITIPRLGNIHVAGQSLGAVRQRIADALVASDILRAPTVVVEISSYRPFYIGGTVAKPGAIPFQPGLSVRHAVILAGGLDRRNGPDHLSATDLLDLKAKWRTSNYQLLQVRSQIARLEAELAQANSLDLGGVSVRGVRPEHADALTALEIEQFHDQTKIMQGEDAHYRDVLALIDVEIDVLTKQGTLEEEEHNLQQKQVQAARALAEKGITSITRLQELERESSRISRDLLVNYAYTARARQNKESTQYELEMAAIRKRIELRKELATAKFERLRLEAQIEVQGSALLAAGIALADKTMPPPEPEVTIHRVIDGKEQAVAADMDMPIQPGDVIDVAFAKASQG